MSKGIPAAPRRSVVEQASSEMFFPISLEDYIQKHLAANPSVDREDLEKRLRFALESARAGERCECGGPIWVIGSAEVGLSCFTCITGEATPSEDYELADAIDELAG